MRVHSEQRDGTGVQADVRGDRDVQGLQPQRRNGPLHLPRGRAVLEPGCDVQGWAGMSDTDIVSQGDPLVSAHIRITISL